MHSEVKDAYYTLALQPGALIAERYRLVRPVGGSSAFAITYLAEDSQTGAPVIVKEFFPRSLVGRGADGSNVRPHSPEDERDFVRALRRFVHEGAALAEISHPHLVRARRLVEANGTAYLVMDRHDGKPLADFVRGAGGRVTPVQAGVVVQNLLAALEPLHAESIVHRDVSPQSVYMLADGRPILIGFSARRHVLAQSSDLAPGFAAFEQYGTRDVGPWTDVYAAAAILYYLLTGNAPPSALDRAAGDALASPASLVTDLPQGLALAVLRGLALLPQQRPHAASEFRRQLETALGESMAATPGRGAGGPAHGHPAAMSGDGAFEDRHRAATTMNLAAGGIVVPNEERTISRLIRRVGDAAGRLRRASLNEGSVVHPDLTGFAREVPRETARPRREAPPEPVGEPLPNDAQTVVSETAKEVVRESVPATAREVVLATAQEVVPATVQEPLLDAKQKPVHEAVKEPIAQSESEVVPQAADEVLIEKAPASVIVPLAAAEPAPSVSETPRPARPRSEPRAPEPMRADPAPEQRQPAPAPLTVTPPLPEMYDVEELAPASPITKPSRERVRAAPKLTEAAPTAAPVQLGHQHTQPEMRSVPRTQAERQWPRRTVLLAAAAIVFSLGVGLTALFVRSAGLRAQGLRADNAPQQIAAGAPRPDSTTTTQNTSSHSGGSSSAVVQGGARTEVDRSAALSAPLSTTRTSAPSRDAGGASTGNAVAERPASPVPTLPPLNVAIPGGGPELNMLPPEVLVDVRTRLANGEEQADQGEYRAARRIFRVALQQIDSAAARYPESQALRNLRRQIEQADQNTLRACIAENELHRKRGEQPGQCQ